MNNFPEYKKTAVHDLIPYARNARTHSDAQVDKIAASIREFGFLNPVITDGDNGIVAGHGRVMAAKKLGMETVPTLEADHLTGAQKRAYIIADNRLALDAGWDEDLLRVEFEELDAMGFDVDLTGFDISEIDALFPEQVEEGLTDDDAVPEMQENPVTVEGDVWVLGRHRLMCGDSTNIEHCERLISKANCDMVFTDPMYNDHTKGFTSVISALGIKHIVLMTTFRQAISILHETNWSFKFDCVLYFKTPSSMMNKSVPYYLHKNVFYVTTDESETSIFNCDNAKGVFSDAGYYPSVIESKKNTQEEHGLSKPIEAIMQLMSGYSAKTVLDIFGGSGSTLIACEKTGRDCCMMEIDSKYCDVIIKRWQDFTGQKAIHDESGKTFDEVSNA